MMLLSDLIIKFRNISSLVYLKKRRRLILILNKV